ncbi:hypothetical protein Trichorick_00761 [Candidatus Trichorickettsia mobilis]|uniref:Uncharacterized protein n=1 Tax=Candidatus Trichorickettsia mobilis TaxID=1346319 RepID=A0ABZ0UTE1_9RICK|nr:hypothetical protein [Candidatus Trichorickettsia mobilis]WPY00871.1 hypothetical protein Trichorick_00761 [Candidatus Trichorickettsia mobilis]
MYEGNIKYLELKTQFDKIISDNQHLAVNPDEVEAMGLGHHNLDIV